MAKWLLSKAVLTTSGTGAKICIARMSVKAMCDFGRMIATVATIVFVCHAARGINVTVKKGLVLVLLFMATIDT